MQMLHKFFQNKLSVILSIGSYKDFVSLQIHNYFISFMVFIQITFNLQLLLLIRSIISFSDAIHFAITSFNDVLSFHISPLSSFIATDSLTNDVLPFL